MKGPNSTYRYLNNASKALCLRWSRVELNSQVVGMIKASSLANLNFGWRKETSVWGRSFRLLEKLKRWRRILKHWTAPKNMRRAGIHQWKNLKPDWILSAQENSTLTWSLSWDNNVINAQANMKDVPTDITHEIKSQNKSLLSIISTMWILKLAKYTQR